MWPALMVAARTYAPFVVFPFAFIIGAIGYSIEGISTLFIPDKPFGNVHKGCPTIMGHFGYTYLPCLMFSILCLLPEFDFC